MQKKAVKDINDFYVAGINYKRSGASIRGDFAVNKEQYAAILDRAKNQDLDELFILSTCNRTEIYGFATSPGTLINLLCSETTGDAQSFRSFAYIKKGLDAVEHAFLVGAGLDSQILGDYEIVGQLKTAAKFAKEKGFLGGFTERLINMVLQSSKLVKTNTGLSYGTVSVSFAAVQYIKATIPDASSKNILLIGTGKIGRNTTKNLVDYLGTKNISLVNRSPEKARALAAELDLKSATLDNLDKEIAAADIILIATTSATPLIFEKHLSRGSKKLIIDLSVPTNVEAAVKNMPGVCVINVDELSRLKDGTLKQRLAEVPAARSIIADVFSEFQDWYEMRRYVPVLKDLKLKLKQLYSHPSCAEFSASGTNELDGQIQRVLNDTAVKLKVHNRSGCYYITALNDFITARN